jgi:hypothetical protein
VRVVPETGLRIVTHAQVVKTQKQDCVVTARGRSRNDYGGFFTS